MNKRGVFRICDVIGPTGVGVQLPDGTYGRAVPLPFYIGMLPRWRAAWQVLTGEAVAFKWPTDYELNKVLRDSDK